nr:hypothetical protein [Kofleriaceae bacterium]
MPRPASLATLALALAVAVLVGHWRVVVGGETWDDVPYHTEVAPPRLAAAHAVARGEVPGWWEASGLGEPLLGEPAHGALAPASWLARTPRALDLVMVLNLWWAALGVALWARRRGAGDLAALAAGLLVATSGALVSAAVRGALPGIAMLPWLAVAASALADARGGGDPAARDAGAPGELRRRRARAAAGVGAALAAIALAGELAVVVDALLVVAALATRAAWRWFAAAVVAGLAIGAAQWLPALLQLPAEVGAHAGALPWSRFVELVVPASFGSGDAARASPAVAGAAAFAPSIYAGVPLLVLARPRGRLVAALAAIAVLVLVTGRGAAAGWPRWAGAPELHVAALVALLGAPSAAGLDALASGERRARFALAVGLAAVVAASVALALHAGAAAESTAALVGALTAIAIAGALAAASSSRANLRALALALVVAPGFGAMGSIAPTTDRAVVAAPPAWALAPGGPWPRRTFRPEHLFRAPPSLADAMATLAGESAYWWGLGQARSEDPARSPELDAVWLQSAHIAGAALDRYGIAFPILPYGTAAGNRIEALLPPRELAGVDWTVVAYPTSPPASVMTSWRWSTDDRNSLSLLFPTDGVLAIPRGTVVLHGTGPANAVHEPATACAIASWEDGDIALQCAAPHAGYAVVSSTAAAGWTATIDDGDPQPWLTADVIRRAVAIPAGSHAVHWTYAPPGFAAGALIAAGGLLVLAALGVLSARARRGATRGATGS